MQGAAAEAAEAAAAGRRVITNKEYIDIGQHTAHTHTHTQPTNVLYYSTCRLPSLDRDAGGASADKDSRPPQSRRGLRPRRRLCQVGVMRGLVGGKVKRAMMEDDGG